MNSTIRLRLPALVRRTRHRPAHRTGRPGRYEHRSRARGRCLPGCPARACWPGPASLGDLETGDVEVGPVVSEPGTPGVVRGSTQPLAVGLLGPFGRGKSSVVRLLAVELRDQDKWEILHLSAIKRPRGNRACRPAHLGTPSRKSPTALPITSWMKSPLCSVMPPLTALLQSATPFSPHLISPRFCGAPCMDRARLPRRRNGPVPSSRRLACSERHVYSAPELQGSTDRIASRLRHPEQRTLGQPSGGPRQRMPSPAPCRQQLRFLSPRQGPARCYRLALSTLTRCVENWQLLSSASQKDKR